MLQIKDYFTGYPSQLSVAEMFLRYGISVRDCDAYIGDIKQADSAISRAVGVDRRVVRSTIERISMNPDLSALFSKIRCIADLSDASSILGNSAIEIVPDDDSRPGTMAGIMNILSSLDLNVRQAVVSGGEDGGKTHLVITVEGPIPPAALAEIRDSPGVAQVILR